MTTVVSSTYSAGAAQADGRFDVTERHLLSDGRDVAFNYRAEANVDPTVVMTARAVRVQDQINANEAAVLASAAGSVPLTKYQFRQRFTYAERLAVDAFNAGFEGNAGLTAEQKAAIRTNLNDFAASGAVYLDNPATAAGVQLYETLGLIAAGRAAEILSNG